SIPREVSNSSSMTKAEIERSTQPAETASNAASLRKSFQSQENLRGWRDDQSPAQTEQSNEHKPLIRSKSHSQPNTQRFSDAPPLPRLTTNSRPALFNTPPEFASESLQNAPTTPSRSPAISHQQMYSPAQYGPRNSQGDSPVSGRNSVGRLFDNFRPNGSERKSRTSFSSPVNSHINLGFLNSNDNFASQAWNSLFNKPEESPSAPAEEYIPKSPNTQFNARLSLDYSKVNSVPNEDKQIHHKRQSNSDSKRQSSVSLSRRKSQSQDLTVQNMDAAAKFEELLLNSKQTTKISLTPGYLKGDDYERMPTTNSSTTSIKKKIPKFGLFK
ncbi:hypothetical protein HK096_011027, partial [Nowakowskiella sp. JEL0078]